MIFSVLILAMSLAGGNSGTANYRPSTYALKNLLCRCRQYNRPYNTTRRVGGHRHLGPCLCLWAFREGTSMSDVLHRYRHNGDEIRRLVCARHYMLTSAAVGPQGNACCFVGFKS